jgi:hypothetical protein
MTHRPTSELSDGNHSVYVNCTDEFGNTGMSQIIYIYSDATGPKVLNITPTAGKNYSISAAVNISANVTDMMGVSKVFANVSWNGGSGLYEMTIAGDIYEVMFYGTNVFGVYNITIIANDSLGKRR